MADNQHDTSKYKLLIVDDDRYVREVLVEALAREDYEIETATSGEHAITVLKKKKYDLVLTDLKMKKLDGLQLLKHIRATCPQSDVIIITAYGTVETAVNALKMGAYDYVLKPIEVSKLRNLVSNVLNHRHLRNENLVLRQQLERQILPENILGNSDQILKIKMLIKQIAVSDVTVLIEGESGTGKELVARSIHNLSPRKDRAFITVNCGALPDTLFESELFGHEKGSFTGALYQRKGRFELADNGTLFLDEIAEISTESQVNFLRVLEDRKIRRIGADQEFGVDVRIIAATNKDLKKKVAQNHFREDLYYRLNVISIKIPPLRQRKEDIPVMVKAFIQEFAVRHAMTPKDITPDTMKRILEYHWPGNIRELRNLIERALLLAPGQVITNDFFSFDETPVTETPQNHIAIPLGSSLKHAEKEIILSTLKNVRGHRKNAAQILGISLRSLQYRLKEYDQKE